MEEFTRMFLLVALLGWPIVFIYIMVRYDNYGTLISWGKCAYCSKRIWASEDWRWFQDNHEVKPQLRDRTLHYGCYRFVDHFA